MNLTENLNNKTPSSIYEDGVLLFDQNKFLFLIFVYR